MQGNTAQTIKLSGAPFSFDGKREIKTLTELKKLYDQIVAKKGKRNLKAGSLKIRSSAPGKIVVVITIAGDDEAITITVKTGEDFRVIGFLD